MWKGPEGEDVAVAVAEASVVVRVAMAVKIAGVGMSTPIAASRASCMPLGRASSKYEKGGEEKAEIYRRPRRKKKRVGQGWRISPEAEWRSKRPVETAN